jgi:hypothetical protein
VASKFTPDEAARSMLARYITPAVARSMATDHAMDYAEGTLGRTYWLDVIKAIDAQVRARSV